MASINVYVRMRPFLNGEREEAEKSQRITLAHDCKQVKAQLTDTKEKCFRFNHVFNDSFTQSNLYDGINATSMIERVVDGYHSTIFAYGQTGSGKTYTIEGNDTAEEEGLIPRSIRKLFQLLEEKNHSERDYKAYISFIQIYNESIYDLIDINENKPLKMRWNKHQQFTIQNVFEGQCRSAEEAMGWWQKGQKNKIMGSHKMNATSSRSHCVLTLRVHSSDMEDPSDQIDSKLEIVDLAGSERQKVTKSSGVIFREGIEINKSLFTLRQVIAALYEASINMKTSILPPYRDSKLTSLLKQSIGGNSYCVMIACLNPQTSHFEQSLQTLTYASMASHISNIPTRNIDPKIQENIQLKDLNSQLKKQIKNMSQHIEYLTKLLESNACPECKKSKQLPSLTESQRQESIEPTGLVTFPKLSDVYRQRNNIERKSIQRVNSEKIQSAEKKLIKTPKEILQSIQMIRELIAANTLLRDKLENMSLQFEQQAKETFLLMKENQELRDRWDMPRSTLVPANQKESEFSCAIYEKIFRKDRGGGQTPKQQSHNTSLPVEIEEIVPKMSYNQFLKSRGKKNKNQHSAMRKKSTSTDNEKVDNSVQK